MVHGQSGCGSWNKARPSGGMARLSGALGWTMIVGGVGWPLHRSPAWTRPSVWQAISSEKAPPRGAALYRPGLHIALANAGLQGGNLLSRPGELRDRNRGRRDCQGHGPNEHQNPGGLTICWDRLPVSGLALRSTPGLPRRLTPIGGQQTISSERLPGRSAEALITWPMSMPARASPSERRSPATKPLRFERSSATNTHRSESQYRGIIYERRGLPETAIRFSEQALEIFQTIGNDGHGPG